MLNSKRSRNVLRLRDGVRGAGQHSDLSRLPGIAGCVAGREISVQWEMAIRTGLAFELYGSDKQTNLPKELFLPGFAEGLSNLPV